MTSPNRERPSATRTGLTSGHSSSECSTMSGDLPGEPEERVSPLGVPGELVEAGAPRREQDYVTRACEIPCPLDGLFEIGGPVDHVLPALIFEVRGDAWPGLTLAHDRPARFQARQHLREVRAFLRTAEDEN